MFENMSVKRDTIRYGAAAAVLALIIIAGSIYFTSSIGTRSSLQGSEGQLDILLTDPPTVPQGVTAVFVTYSDIAVHVSGAGNQSGWTTVNGQGTIDLMQLVNVSTTIAAVKVTSGVYNALRFNVTSSEVTYSGKNYTAFVPRAELTVVIPGGIQVNATASSAALIDMNPTVVNIGSQSDPEFIVNTQASCFRIPGSVYNSKMDFRGYTMSLNSTAWWRNSLETYTSAIQITNVTLTSGVLSVTIKNTGNQSVNLTTTTVTPVGNMCAYLPGGSQTSFGGGRDHRQNGLPQCLSGSAYFEVLQNGTLEQIADWSLTGSTPQFTLGSNLQAVFTNSGYQLAAGKSVTLTFTGTVSLGFSLRQMPQSTSAPGVVSGDQYDITVIGQQALAAYVVVAS